MTLAKITENPWQTFSYWAAALGSAVIEGKESIRQWSQKVLEAYTTKITSFVPGPLRAANGWATNRFTMSG